MSTIRIVCARIRHTCCECYETIEPGEHYERVDGLWDGAWDTYYTCLPCRGVREDLCPCGAYGDLREDLMESCDIDYLEGGHG